MENKLKGHVRYLKGVGEKRADALGKLGINTIEELLFYFPRDYENWSSPISIADAPFDEISAVRGTVLAKPLPIKTRGGKLMYRTSVSGTGGIMTVTFFNNRFAAEGLEADHEYIFYGKIKENAYGGKEMTAPKYGSVTESEGLHPVYRCSSLINSKAIAKIIRSALDSYGMYIEDPLPREQIIKYRLPCLKDALYGIHFPKNEEDIKSSRRRLIYEELLILQLGILSHKTGEDEISSHIIREDYTEEFIKALPFSLTNAQKRAIGECVRDMKMHSPMKRLLQGDVGSGKTAVAAALMYNTVRNGYQCVLMAPTEVLARQHYDTFNRFFDGSGTKTVLLTGSTTAKNKKIIKEMIASGEADIIIGTHAVITGDTVFSDCALVITDEQHRFGVKQRAALRAKGNSPHVLVMSATPIPRTLSLIIYGDLSISVLDEKPKGRQDIKTVSVSSEYHERIYGFIKKEVASGRQCYIVCPMVEENEEAEVELKSAKEYYSLLSKTVFSDIRCGLLHGQMPQKKKDEAMTAFKNGETDVLFCTVVIEVGIDVPNASVMVIENAERFGLSQLHQLRGRVGRGDALSHCVLVSDSKGETAENRFDILCKTNDGFLVAEEDLKLRGPGDFFGERQSGLPMLRLASLMTDSRILYAARDEAESILKKDPFLQKEENKRLKEKTSVLFADIS